MSNWGIGFFAPTKSAAADDRSRMSFTIAHEAYYRDLPDPGVVAQIWIHREALTADGRHDGVHWEFGIRWHDLSHSGPSAQVCIFHDAWQAFYEIPEFFGALARLGPRPSVEDVVSLLHRLGWVDTTDRDGRRAR